MTKSSNSKNPGRPDRSRFEGMIWNANLVLLDAVESLLPTHKNRDSSEILGSQSFSSNTSAHCSPSTNDNNDDDSETKGSSFPIELLNKCFGVILLNLLISNEENVRFCGNVGTGLLLVKESGFKGSCDITAQWHQTPVACGITAGTLFFANYKDRRLFAASGGDPEVKIKRKLGNHGDDRASAAVEKTKGDYGPADTGLLTQQQIQNLVVFILEKSVLERLLGGGKTTDMRALCLEEDAITGGQIAVWGTTTNAAANTKTKTVGGRKEAVRYLTPLLQGSVVTPRATANEDWYGIKDSDLYKAVRLRQPLAATESTKEARDEWQSSLETVYQQLARIVRPPPRRELQSEPFAKEEQESVPCSEMQQPTQDRPKEQSAYAIEEEELISFSEKEPELMQAQNEEQCGKAHSSRQPDKETEDLNPLFVSSTTTSSAEAEADADAGTQQEQSTDTVEPSDVQEDSEKHSQQNSFITDRDHD